MGDLIDLLPGEELAGLLGLIAHEEVDVTAAPAEVDHERVDVAAALAVSGGVLHHHEAVLCRPEGLVELLDVMNLLHSLVALRLLHPWRRRGSQQEVRTAVGD